MEFVCSNSTHEDKGDLSCNVYQLQRLPRRGQWEKVTKECLHNSFLDSLKECLWPKWPSAQPEGEHRQIPANVPWPDPQLEFAAVRQDLCEGMLAIARDTHCWALGGSGHA